MPVWSPIAAARRELIKPLATPSPRELRCRWLHTSAKCCSGGAPPVMLQRIRTALDHAGNPISLDAFLAINTLAVGGPLLLYIAYLLGSRSQVASPQFLVLAFLVVLGFSHPTTLVERSCLGAGGGHQSRAAGRA